jgi:valine--pyruvate aminotransferase
MKLSEFGEKFTQHSGIVELMDDLGEALASNRPMIMLGGGNPSHIPEVQARFRDSMYRILERPGEFERMVGNYAAPQGSQGFIHALAKLLKQEFGWDVSPKNIALTNGSQNAFFLLFNMFAGPCPDGGYKRILLPLAPEYIGYDDVGVLQDIFVSSKPTLEYLGQHSFKYHVDFDAIQLTDEVGAICVSRPTNPTGNVLTDEEISLLSALAKSKDIPFIIDNAYGTPFPNIIFEPAQPVWDESIIVCMSLSKLGLPGVRTGIVIANEQVIAALSAMNAVLSLAPGSVGAHLVTELTRTGEIIQISKTVIRPYYQRKAQQAVAWFNQAFGETDFYIHKPEGALFLWLWFKDLPITTYELYQRLKAKGVLVVPGHYFFPGMTEDWRHKEECIRVNYAGDKAAVKAGIKIIAAEVKQAYSAA